MTDKKKEEFKKEESKKEEISFDELEKVTGGGEFDSVPRVQEHKIDKQIKDKVK